MSANLLQFQRQITQFDTSRSQASIATPTCSSCCCCCCCLGVAVGAAVALPMDATAKVTKKKNQQDIKYSAGLSAAFALPSSLGFGILLLNVFPSFLPSIINIGPFIGIAVATAIILIPAFVLLWIAYKKGSSQTPGLRAVGVLALVAVALFIEGFIGMFILSVAPALYLIIAAGIAIAIIAWATTFKKYASKKPKA